MHRLGKKDKKQFEVKKKELKEKTKFLQNSLKIPFMEAKGAYHVLAKVLKLEHIKENIFKDKFGNKFALTKYGFEDCEQFNYKHECNKLEIIIKEHTEARLANFRDMKNKIESQRNEIEQSKEFRENISDILENEDNLYKKLELIENLISK